MQLARRIGLKKAERILATDIHLVVRIHNDRESWPAIIYFDPSPRCSIKLENPSTVSDVHNAVRILGKRPVLTNRGNGSPGIRKYREHARLIGRSCF